MKRVISRATLAVALVVLGLTSQAQNTRFGIKAEANMSNYILDEMAGWKSEFGFGASVGWFSRVSLCNFFALQPEMLFHLKQSEFKIDGTKNDFRLAGMEVPVYAVFQLVGAKNNRAFIGVGPYGQVGFVAKNRTLDQNYYKNFIRKGNSFMQIGDVGCAAMIGFEFRFGLQINASYKYGFINQLNKPNEVHNCSESDCCHHSHLHGSTSYRNQSKGEFFRNQSIALGLGFRF